MKSLNRLLLIVFCSGLILVYGYAYLQTATLTLKITNILDYTGEMQIAIYDKKENFPKKGLEFKNVILQVQDSILEYTFKDLPKGEYAIAVFHDKNSDGKCNRNLLGIPKEGYGFSNNIKPKLSVPSFKKTKFSLENSKTITINLIQKR